MPRTDRRSPRTPQTPGPGAPWVLALCLSLAAGLSATPPAAAALAVGSAAPPFQLSDAQGKTHSLEQYRGQVVVLEWINPRCPFSRRQAVERAMIETAARFPKVVWLAINSTNPTHGDYLEPAEHLAYNAERGITYPVLYDSSGDTGRAYGAQTTPHMFIVDAQGTVVYNGAIDDDPPGRKAKGERVNYVAAALAAEAARQPITPASTKPYGCTVKY